MDETALNIKKNTRILLARNSPVALVVGAASFFGSHLIDKLLAKGLQVVGADDLSINKRANLAKAVESKNFHLVIEDIEKLDLQVEKLDYFFIIPQKGQNFQNILANFKNLKSRLLLISSVELYDPTLRENKLQWLKKIEMDVAKLAKIDNLNARILRLGPIFGPRMDFNPAVNKDDPMLKLIHQALVGNLQKENSLEFSTRSLYIDDACNLAIKCIFAGATAQKIFDGVQTTPVKVAEAKQVLLDPNWYERRDFIPTPLPPWSTPNLERTEKFLNWHPKLKLVEQLQETLNYFKKNDISIPQYEESLKVEEQPKVEGWKTEKIGDLKGLKGESKPDSDKKGHKEDNKGTTDYKKTRLAWPKLLRVNRLVAISVFLFVFYALIWPFFELGWAVFAFKSNLSEALDYLEKGQFEKSILSIKEAKGGVKRVETLIYSYDHIQSLGILKNEFDSSKELLKLANQSVDSAESTVKGVQNLIASLKSITGESTASPKEYLEAANISLASSDEELSKAFALLGSSDFNNRLPEILKPVIGDLSERLGVYSNLVKKGRALSLLLPEVVGMEGRKDYLVLLQNNNELRPTGGFIGSFAKVSFEGGKLKKLEVNDVYAIDGQLSIHVEPPKEIKEDLGQKDYFLRDANWEPDFPTSGRQIEWFYNKETGERVAGVVALDISAIEDLLGVIGSLDLPDYNEKITSQNLFEKAISHAEVNFFPGTQAKKSFLTALATSLFNKLFFLPNQNWPMIVTSLGRSLEQKHMSIYLDDPKLFSYVISQNWAGVLPRPSQDNKDTDFLAPVEANLGANKANYYIDRTYKLETVIGKDADINHRLRISYTNRSPSTAFPGGKYKNRMRIYLPSGTKLNRVLWGEADLTKDAQSFVEYGRAGYSYLIELQPKEQKTLVLDYQPPIKLNFKDKKAEYRLDIIKQAGTLKDPFIWEVTYPINLRLSSNQAQKIGPQQHSIKTDLSTDKTLKLEFTRP